MVADLHGAHRADAAHAAALAWKNCLDVLDGGDEELRRVAAVCKQRHARLHHGKVATPQPIPEREQELLAVIEIYLELTPGAPDAAALQYDRARVLHAHDHIAEALPLFRDIVAQHPDSEQAIPSAQLFVDCQAAALGK